MRMVSFVHKIAIVLGTSVCFSLARRLRTSTAILPDPQSAGIQNIFEAYASLLGTVKFSTAFNPSGARLLLHAARPSHRFPAVGMESEGGPEPEDWRAFRAKLISSGIRVMGEDEDKDDGESSTEEKPLERISVAPANEELLKKQDEQLWKEYLQGGWAHETSLPEVGGLMCRLSLEGQLVRRMRISPNSSALVQRLYDRLCSQLPADVDTNSSSESEFQRLLTTWSSNTMYMYRLAESMKKEYAMLFRENVVNGVLDLSKQTNDLKEFVLLAVSEQQEWQSVALVLEKRGPDTEATRCVQLNRPAIAGGALSRTAANQLLNGQTTASPEYDDAFVERFLEAFGKQAAVYVGGTEKQSAPGTLIHGYDLPGASEIAPGTRIYSGGVRAAVEAVLAKERSPLDFRWFIGELGGASVVDHEWSSIACARPLALKQCLRLPKPLWHEVMQLCGGDLKSFSQIEIQKRTDLDSS